MTQSLEVIGIQNPAELQELPEGQETLSGSYSSLQNPEDMLQFLKGRELSLNTANDAQKQLVVEGLATTDYPNPKDRVLLKPDAFEFWYNILQKAETQDEILDALGILEKLFPEAVCDNHVNQFVKWRATLKERVEEGKVEIKKENLMPKELMRKYLTEVGGVLNLGWHWFPKEVFAADFGLIRIHEGKLQRLCSTRKDMNAKGYVGGVRDNILNAGIEDSLLAVLRETKEETALELQPDDIDTEVINTDLLMADPRMTILGYFRTTFIFAIASSAESMEKINATELKPQEEEATGVYWQTIDEDLIKEELEKGIPGHAYLDLLLIRHFEAKFAEQNIVVGKDGRLYKSNKVSEHMQIIDAENV